MLLNSPQIIKLSLKFVAGSVLLLDEANSSSDVAINMDAVERERYTTQMQLIEQDVSGDMAEGLSVLPRFLYSLDPEASLTTGCCSSHLQC